MWNYPPSRKVNNNLQCEPFWDSNRTVIGWCWFHRVERILFIDRSYATNDICRNVHKFLAGKMYLVFHCWCRAIALKRNFEPLTPCIFPFEAEVLLKEYMQQNFSNKKCLNDVFLSLSVCRNTEYVALTYKIRRLSDACINSIMILIVQCQGYMQLNPLTKMEKVWFWLRMHISESQTVAIPMV